MERSQSTEQRCLHYLQERLQVDREERRVREHKGDRLFENLLEHGRLALLRSHTVGETDFDFGFCDQFCVLGGGLGLTAVCWLGDAFFGLLILVLFLVRDVYFL